MERERNLKLILANNVLIEVDALKECKNLNATITLADILIRDALSLAEEVKAEEVRMNSKKTLLIDDIREIDADVVCRTYDAGISALKNLGPFSVLYLDHDLGDEDMGKTGYGIMNFLEANPDLKPDEVVLVTSNPVGRQRMKVVVERIYGNKE